MLVFLGDWFSVFIQEIFRVWLDLSKLFRNVSWIFFLFSCEVVFMLEQFLIELVFFCRCGYCKKLVFEYEKVVKELSKRFFLIFLAKVDVIVEIDLVKRFDVFGYFILKIFRKGKFFDYNGLREKYGIVVFFFYFGGKGRFFG